MNESGLALEDRPGDKESLRSVRRAVHTLKGDSTACGFRELSELAHELEDVLTPELTQQHAGLIPEVVLAAADTFHEMLAAYRNNLQPRGGGALREHIQRLLTKPAVQQKRVAREATFEWTEYERLVIAEALRRGDHIYNVALYLDSESLPAAAFELVRKALEGAGKVLAQRPEKAADLQQSGVIEMALSTPKPADWIRKRCQVPSVVARISVDEIKEQQTQPRDLLDILLESEAAAISAGVSGSEHVAPGHLDDTHTGRYFARGREFSPRRRHAYRNGYESGRRIDYRQIDVAAHHQRI